MASDHEAVAGREPDRERERQLFEILADYFEAVEAGQAPDLAEWLARYPDWAEEIARFLDDQDRLLKLTEPLRPIGETAGGEDSASGLTAMLGPLTAGPEPAIEPRNGSASYPAGTKVRYIGDYELIDEIARGGMGVVFRARPRSLNRPVALKMLRAEILMNKADEQRFRQEAEAAANLDHPNIVPIFEVGRHDGHSYFSMKLVEGGSLAQRLPDFASDQRAAARLMETVARAVHHAHQRGVLHRDLKPSNILLSGGPDTPIEQLEPHVTDFGLAKRVGGDSELTQSGAIVGTPSYMAPEQAIGKKGLITVATDVYGLGAVLYTLLSGRPPFQGDSALETIAQVKDRALDPPSRHGRRVNRDLETVCLKCLEKEPARRYGSAQAVAEDLERWLAGVPILARPASRAERAWRWCRRNPLGMSLLATGTLLLTLVVAGLISGTRVRQTTRRLSSALHERERAVRRHQFVTDLQQASHLLEGGRVSESRALLSRHLPATDQEDVRDFAWHFLWRRCHTGRPPLQGHRGDVYHATFSPDGDTLATASLDRTVRLWDVHTGKTRRILPARPEDGHVDDINWVAFAPDGRSLATASDDQNVKLWDAASGALRLTLTGHRDRVLGVIFTPEGKQLVSCDRGGGVIVWDATTGRRQSSFPVDNATIESMAISPNGRTLAISGKGAALWDLADGRELARLEGHTDTVFCVVFSHDGKTLATSSRDWSVRLWDVRDGHALTTFRGHRTGVQSVAFSPGDRTLASVDDFGIVRFWDMASGAIGKIASGQDRLWCVKFAPDGRTLATTGSDATARLWDPVQDRDRIVLHVPTAIVHSIASSADGDMLTAAGGNGTLWTWDTADGRLVATKHIDAGAAVRCAVLSRDAATLAINDPDRTITLWDVKSGRRTGNLVVAQGPISPVAFFPEGRGIAAAHWHGCDAMVTVWDAESGSSQQLAIGPASHLAISPRGQTLAAGSWDGGKPTLWDLASGRSRIPTGLDSQDSISALDFSPDGRTLATGSKDRTIKLWDITTLELRFTGFDHDGDVQGIMFSPDGRTLAVGAGSGVKLWDVAAQEAAITLDEHPGAVRHVCFSPDRSTLATCSESPHGGWDVFLWRTSERE